MQLIDLCKILWRRKWIIVFTVLATMAVVTVGVLNTPPTYKVSTILRIATTTSVATSYADYQYADRLLNTFLKLITSSPLLDELNKKLNIERSPSITAEILPNTELIQITVEDRDPNIAYRAANTLVEILLAQSSQLYTGGSKNPADVIKDQLSNAGNDLNQVVKIHDDMSASDPTNISRISMASKMVDSKQRLYDSLLEQYQQTFAREAIRANAISIVDPVQYVSSNSKVLIFICLGLVTSLLGGLGLAFLFENLDTTLYTSREIEDISKQRIFATMPWRSKKDRKALVSNTFLYACVKLLSSQSDAGHQRTFLLTSSEKGEGKSTFIRQFAYTLTALGKKVIVIDCNFGAPILHILFKSEGEYGLSDFLGSKLPVESVIQSSDPVGVSVIPAGRHRDGSVQLLNSQKMNALINHVSQKYDIVLIDSSAVMTAPDALLLAPLVEEVLLVVKCKSVHKDSLSTVCKQLEEIQARVFGLVVYQ